MTEQSMDTTTVQLGEPVSFIGVSHRITEYNAILQIILLLK